MGVTTGDWAALFCSAPGPAPAPLPPLTQRLGCRELRRLEAELSRDLRPGVLEDDFPPGVEEEDWALLEPGVEVDKGPALVPGLNDVPCDVSSLDAPVDFLLDFLLDTLFLFNISDSLMLLPPS